MPLATRLGSALLLGLAAAAQAGVYIETAQRDGPKDETPEVRRVYVQGGLGRFEDGGSYSILKGETLTIVNPGERTYTVLDREAIRALGARMGGAMAQMRERMAAMTPEQRAMLERMMGGQMPGAAAEPAKLEVVDAGRSERVDGRSCRVFTVKRGGVAEEQHCVVPFDALPGNEDLRALFERLASLLRELHAALPQSRHDANAEYEAFAKMNGYPVLTRELSDGKPTGEETRLVAWRAEPVPAAKFEVPPAYARRELAPERER